jgi:hypothetical protein
MRFGKNHQESGGVCAGRSGVRDSRLTLKNIGKRWTMPIPNRKATGEPIRHTFRNSSLTARLRGFSRSVGFDKANFTKL